MGYSYRKQIQAYHKNQKTHIPYAYEQELNLLQLYFSNKYNHTPTQRLTSKSNT